MKLKPCPFCGCNIVAGDESDHDEGCFMTLIDNIGDNISIETIQKAWNTRCN